MTTKKRPPLSDNISGADDTGAQLDQVAAIERMQRGEGDTATMVAAEAPPVTDAAAPVDAAPAPIPEPAVEPAPAAPAIAAAPIAAPIAAPAARQSGGGGAAAGVALAILVAGATIGGAVLYTDELRALLPPTALQTRVASLEASVGLSASGKSLVERVTSLEKAVTTTDGRIADLAGASRVSGVIAARQLRAALGRSTPFSTELALFRLSGFADPDTAKAVDRLAGKADGGIATRAELLARYALMVPEVLRIELGTNQAGISDTVWSWVNGVAGVLRIPGAEAGPEDQTAALLAQAGLLLEGGDLPGAIDHLSKLDPTLAAPAAPWLAEARARLDAEQAVELLEGRIAKTLSASAR
ncbi:mitofilin family membrane protein [Azospirillum sp. TSO35-2]|uniref:mitofilin family membrane protein n=1 Tax=Azospirillum sp. TSO35-2 TaxID=716796 RepID=UPI000D651A80|nr:mitofilin family membrane protein [Azospirillum sp. TSO35-2]